MTKNLQLAPNVRRVTIQAVGESWLLDSADNYYDAAMLAIAWTAR